MVPMKYVHLLLILPRNAVDAVAFNKFEMFTMFKLIFSIVKAVVGMSSSLTFHPHMRRRIFQGKYYLCGFCG